ncbi:hypothetical protein HZH68_009012 [Vespula germanica]|uniref:Uncharacterized protein n=1 Tax=Vespula germanica TaxID=30212 RepID=A0A834N6R6_VESGE|nr:hypothetical protein HZH68_009012 [Vespula germanica]
MGTARHSESARRLSKEFATRIPVHLENAVTLRDQFACSVTTLAVSKGQPINVVLMENVTSLRGNVASPYSKDAIGITLFYLQPFPTLPYCAIMELAELQFCEMQSLAAYECITENARDKRLYRESWIATSSAKLAITFAEVSSGTGDSGYLNYEIDDLLNLASGVLQLNKNKLALGT